MMYICEPPPCVYSSAAQAHRPPRRRYRSRRTLLPPIKTAERNYVWIAANLMAAGGYWEELRARVACIRIPRAAAYVCPKPGASSNHTLERRGGGRRVGVRAPARGDVAHAARHTRGTAPAWCRLPVARRLRGSMQARCAAWHFGNGDLVSHSARAPHKPNTHADTFRALGDVRVRAQQRRGGMRRTPRVVATCSPSSSRWPVSSSEGRTRRV